MGIDRIITLLTQQDNLRDSILFPLMKPLQSNVISTETNEVSEVEKSTTNNEDLSASLEMTVDY
jgi:aspartyl-tRNA synthetase